jgi:adenylosuccinate lyase
MKAWQEEISFQQLLMEDPDVRDYLSEEELQSVFKIDNFLKNVDVIFKRVFGEQ